MIINNHIIKSYTQSTERSLVLPVNHFRDNDVITGEATNSYDSSGKLANLAYMLTVSSGLLTRQ